MKAAEIREMSDEELVEKMGELRSEWRDLRFEEAIGKQINPMRIRQIKRDIARIKTIQTEREIIARMEELLAGKYGHNRPAMREDRRRTLWKYARSRRRSGD